MKGDELEEEVEEEEEEEKKKNKKKKMTKEEGDDDGQNDDDVEETVKFVLTVLKDVSFTKQCFHTMGSKKNRSGLTNIVRVLQTTTHNFFIA